MVARQRIVADTNVLISRLLMAASVPAQALRKAVDQGTLLISEATLDELADVLSRPKFDRYIRIEDRQEFLRLLQSVAELIPIVYPVKACRDPQDDKFLEVALNGRADLIISGDKYLLALHPWRGIAILSPAAYLTRR